MTIKTQELLQQLIIELYGSHDTEVSIYANFVKVNCSMPEAPQLRLFGNVGVAREQVTTQHFINDMRVYKK